MTGEGPSRHTLDAVSRPENADNIDRLTSVADAVNGNESYAFDGVGNRTASHLSNTYTHQPFNRLTATETGSYSQDANGNTVSKVEGSKRWTYSWDYENRLTAVSDRKTRQRHIYDALGRRVQTYGGPAGSVKFTYDGLDVVTDNSSVSGITKYQNGPGIDNKLSIRNGSTASYFLADHLGSTNGLADATGSLTAQTGYDAFGNATNAAFPSRYQFTGREFDSFTGLQFSRARFYDPKLGRFISEDPIGFGGGDVNLYGYVRNQPYIFRDPMGLYPGVDVMANPNIWGPAAAGLAAAGGAILSAAGAAASSPAVVAGVGFGAGYAIGYYPGQWTANHPSNPFVNGPWNPWGTPAPMLPPFPITPPNSSPASRPYCQPAPRAVPWKSSPLDKSPLFPLPYPPQTPDKHEECMDRCIHLLPSPSGDLQSSEFRKCYDACIGKLW